MYAINSHSDSHLIPALGIVMKPTVWVFITSQYPGIHAIGRAIKPRGGRGSSHDAHFATRLVALQLRKRGDAHGGRLHAQYPS